LTNEVLVYNLKPYNSGELHIKNPLRRSV